MEDIRDTAIEFGEWCYNQDLIEFDPTSAYRRVNGIDGGVRLFDGRDYDRLTMEELFDKFLAEKKQNT